MRNSLIQSPSPSPSVSSQNNQDPSSSSADSFSSVSTAPIAGDSGQNKVNLSLENAVSVRNTRSGILHDLSEQFFTGKKTALEIHRSHGVDIIEQIVAKFFELILCSDAYAPFHKKQHRIDIKSRKSFITHVIYSNIIKNKDEPIADNFTEELTANDLLRYEDYHLQNIKIKCVDMFFAEKTVNQLMVHRNLKSIDLSEVLLDESFSVLLLNPKILKTITGYPLDGQLNQFVNLSQIPQTLKRIRIGTNISKIKEDEWQIIREKLGKEGDLKILFLKEKIPHLLGSIPNDLKARVVSYQISNENEISNVSTVFPSLKEITVYDELLNNNKTNNLDECKYNYGNKLDTSEPENSHENNILNNNTDNEIDNETGSETDDKTDNDEVNSDVKNRRSDTTDSDASNYLSIYRNQNTNNNSSDRVSWVTVGEQFKEISYTRHMESPNSLTEYIELKDYVDNKKALFKINQSNQMILIEKGIQLVIGGMRYSICFAYNTDEQKFLLARFVNRLFV